MERNKGFKINGSVWYGRLEETRDLLYPDITHSFVFESNEPPRKVTHVLDLNTNILYVVVSQSSLTREFLLLREETEEECQKRTLRYVLLDRWKVLGIYKDMDLLQLESSIHKYMVEAIEGPGMYDPKITTLWKNKHGQEWESDYHGK